MVKNSILLVRLYEPAPQQGMPLIEAIEKAGEIRFLPVVLTSITAILRVAAYCLKLQPAHFASGALCL